VKEILKKKSSNSSLTIVEAGSGVSTVVLGYLLKKFFPQGKVFSLEHSYDFYEQMKKGIEFHRLGSFAEVFYAPLISYWINGQEWLYYDLKEVKKRLQEEKRKVDVLFVDGPPAPVRKNIRYPILPLLKEFLPEEFLIILDDAKREDEREVAYMWKKELQVFSSWEPETEKGTLILEKIPFRNKELPFFSVCIPTYNRAHYLKQALESVLSQTFDNFEIIVYDDGSTDSTAEVVKKFNDSRIRYFKGEKNRGRPYARNQCVNLAKGDWIVWLDDDDVMKPDLLSSYAVAINRFPSVSVFYPLKLWILYENSKEMKLSQIIDYFKNRKACVRTLMSSPPLPNPGVCIKKSVYDKYGLYDEEFYRAQDYEFWFRILPYEDIKGIDYEGLVYRIHDGNVSTFVELMDYSFESLAKRRFLQRFRLKDIYYFSNEPEELFASDLLAHQDYFNAAYYLWRFEKFSSLEKLLNVLGISDDCERLASKFERYLRLNRLEAAERVSEKLGVYYKKLLQVFAFESADRKVFLASLKRLLLINPFFDLSRFSLSREELEELEKVKGRILRVANKYEGKKKEFIETFWKRKLNESSGCHNS
jgi:glycosyltransferase involved in cell wall biosynthesis